VTLEVFGYCPTQEKDVGIEVEYLDAGQNSYVRGLATCPLASFEPSRCPIRNDCPVLAVAPKRYMGS
jgi:hypothetical protein